MKPFVESVPAEEEITEIHTHGIGQESYAKYVPDGPIVDSYPRRLSFQIDGRMGGSSGWRYAGLSMFVRDALFGKMDIYAHTQTDTVVPEFIWSGHDTLPR